MARRPLQTRQLINRGHLSRATFRQHGLSGINPPFGGLFRLSGQVIHALLTRAPLSPPKGLPVRLACVKHAASVRSEPGSNSPVVFPDHSRMNLKETSRTGLQLFAAASLRNLFRAPAASSRPASMLFSFQRSLPASAFQSRVSARPFRFSRPLLRGGPAFYLAFVSPSRTFLFFLFGVFFRRLQTQPGFLSPRFRSSGDEGGIYSILPPAVKNFFPASGVFFTRPRITPVAVPAIYSKFR